MSVKDILKTMDLLKSEDMARIIGLTVHLAYWMVFGHANPAILDFHTKEHIFVALFELLDSLESRVKVHYKYNLFLR